MLYNKNIFKLSLYLEWLNKVIILKYLKISAFSHTLEIICKSTNNIQSPKPDHKETAEEEKFTELKKHMIKNKTINQILTIIILTIYIKFHFKHRFAYSNV